ncbi:MAG: type II secretion system protein GspE, partial [Gammaproteobacteria bacterium]|nr:type II secretion system protein GspE [Gammaproteobacteria bacterium]
MADLPAQVSARVRLPFGFAKRHGVLLQHVADSWQLLINPNTNAAALLEVRRVIAQPFAVQKLSAIEFEAMLEAAYQRDSSEAQQIMEDIGNEVNLASLADEIPETEDLLENEDDAPIIK